MPTHVALCWPMDSCRPSCIIGASHRHVDYYTENAACVCRGTNCTNLHDDISTTYYTKKINENTILNNNKNQTTLVKWVRIQW